MVFGFSGDAAGGFPHAVGTGGNLALPGGAPFLWRNGEKSTRGCAPGPRGGKSFFPPHPFSLDCCRSGVGFLSAYLACGLQDQRLMARPPARAGGRSGLLTGEKAGNQTVPLCLLPKGTYPRSQPAQPVGGPLRAFRWEGRRPGTKTEVQPPLHNPTREGVPGRNLLPRGFFPPFLPKKWGPGWASQGSLPFQRRRRKTTMAPHPGGPRPRPFQRRRKKPRRETTFFFPTSLICVILWG